MQGCANCGHSVDREYCDRCVLLCQTPLDLETVPSEWIPVDEDKPLGEWTLGECKDYCMLRLGVGRKCIACRLKAVCCVPFHESDILPQNRRLTENEMAICHSIGAKWVSRNDNQHAFVNLWDKKPAENYPGNYTVGNGAALADLNPALFPSIKPGDLLEVEVFLE